MQIINDKCKASFSKFQTRAYVSSCLEMFKRKGKMILSQNSMILRTRLSNTYAVLAQNVKMLKCLRINKNDCSSVIFHNYVSTFANLPGKLNNCTCALNAPK